MINKLLHSKQLQFFLYALLGTVLLPTFLFVKQLVLTVD